MKEKWKETEVAELVVEYLQNICLDVYQEVDFGGPIADIVALRGPEIWIVETKTTWSLDLFSQLWEHKRRCHGHRLFAAVPSNSNDFRRLRIAEDLGFGVITVQRAYLDGAIPTRMRSMGPRTTSNTLPDAMKRILSISEKQRQLARAGSPSSKRSWTPFRLTCDALLETTREHPGISMRDAVKSIKHHYASDHGAVSSLTTWIKAGKVPGLRFSSEPPHRLAIANEGEAI